MATTTQSSTMAKTDFVKSVQYLALTEGQRKWVDIFIETSNANLSTRQAYNATDDAYIAMFTRKIETSPRIIAALDLFFARTPRERFLRDLQNDIAHSTGVAKIEARRLYAKITGIDGLPTDETEALAATVIADARVPADHLEVWSDKKTGVVIGYRAADGTAVKLS